MTVFIAHAPGDRPCAEALEKALERRGHFVELDDGATALRPVRPSDAVVLFVSSEFMVASQRFRLEQRALDAWANDRLVVVKLDDALAPVGLRDLSTIDASVESQREVKLQEAANAVLGLAYANPAGEIEEVERPARKELRRPSGMVGGLLLALFALPGIGALATAISLWLVNRAGTTPGDWSDLRRGVDAFGLRYGAPTGWTEWLFLTAIAVAACMLFIASLAAWRSNSGRVTRTDSAQQEAHPPGTPKLVYVSYAEANADEVRSVIESAHVQGRLFCIGSKGHGSNDGLEGEVVQAIERAGAVLVMCSKAAFESDQVKREVYLADRYRKAVTPVFIERAEPPEDFEYFLAGLPRLQLFETPDAERAQVLLGLLGAAP